MSAFSLLETPQLLPLPLRCRYERSPTNPFWSKPERLPELRYTAYRQSLSARDRSMSQLLRTV